MKTIKTLALILITLQLQSCYIFRAYKHRKFELKDLDKFESIALQASQNPFHFAYNLNSYNKLTTFLDSNLQNSYTYSFLVIKNDSIIYEKYFDTITSSTKQPSFSVAKSFVATLVQMAVQDGFIKSLDEPITNYLTYLKDRDQKFNNITIQHVMNMASGIKWNENYYNPFGDVLRLGFTKNLNNRLKKLKVESAPGKFDYKSVNTQLLASIIEASTKQKLQDYFIKKLWQPLGMEFEATWNVDSKKNNTPRAFCCINAATRDFAKFGKLYLQKGKYNGLQMLDEKFINETIHPDSMMAHDGYKNQWWAMQGFAYFKDSIEAINYVSKNNKTSFANYSIYNGIKYYKVKDELAPFMAEGILGQFIYVNPRTNVIIVRLGHYWNHKKFGEKQILNIVNDIVELKKGS